MKRLPWLVCLILLGASTAGAADAPKMEDATLPDRSGRTKETTSGKSIAEIKAKVKELWGGLVFEEGGKPVEYVAILDTDEGPVEIEFLPAKAPNHVRNFLALSQAGFYEGLIFHRCIPGFMIQGGCPEGNGEGGPGYLLKQEFNDTPHERGILSMARAADPNSAGSQFFICVEPARFLDKQYTAFGKVTKGMDVVDRIVVKPTGRQDKPLEPVKIKSVTVKKKGEEAAESK